MLKKVFLGCLIIIFLGGCSNNLFITKERDARNSFKVSPLVIPPNINEMNIGKNKDLDNDLYVEAVVFQLLFNENLGSYNKKNANISLTLNDISFLKMFNNGNDYTQVRDELNKEYLLITNKNKSFLRKFLHWEVKESLTGTSNEYINLNKIK